jgi:ABC-2 type transport system ATP-binding protein
VTDTSLFTLQISDASVYHGKKCILNSLTLSVSNGVVIGLVGPNGSGKTTFLRLAAGLVSSSANCVATNGISPKKRKAYKREVFFVEDLNDLNLAYTGLEYLSLVEGVWGSNVSVDDIVAELRIDSFIHTPLRKLSLGMKQQVLLALAFTSGASLILLDEPMNSLDPDITIIVSRKIRELASKGTSIILSSHLLSSIDALADQVVFLKEGSIAYTRTTNEDIDTTARYEDLYQSTIRLGEKNERSGFG